MGDREVVEQRSPGWVFVKDGVRKANQAASVVLDDDPAAVRIVPARWRAVVVPLNASRVLGMLATTRTSPGWRS
ncbi:MAG: hypothetical protein ACR2OB_01155 [Solirubrobacteraceae bacterium]